MAIVTADSYGIDATGATDVTAALQTAINAQPSGNTFQFHAGGLYLTSGIQTASWAPTNVIIDGQGAYYFRNTRRTGDASTGQDIISFNGASSTLKNLNVYGFRKDVYNGSTLTTISGSPTVSGTTMLLDAQNEEVRLPQVGLDWKANVNGVPFLNFTNYETPFYFRGVDGLVRFEAILSDSTHIASDCRFAVIDDATDTVLASSTLTLTGTPTTYSLTFTPTTLQLGMRLRVQVKKLTATANTITVASITPYGEAGYRRRDSSGVYSPPQGGGNEFSDAIDTGSAANMTIDNCWIEGPDGDGVNATFAGPNLMIRNCTVRGNGRMSYTIEFSTGASIVGCAARESGRSAIDFEPNTNSLANFNTTITNFTCENTRNYSIAMGTFARCFNVILSDITSISSGMGGLYGGAMGMTVSNFTHLSTTRTEADRIANGGRAGVDCIPFGVNVAIDDITTDIGFWIPVVVGNYGPSGPPGTNYTTNNIVVTNAATIHPTLDPAAVVEATNSSVSFVVTGTNAFDLADGLFIPSTVSLFAPSFPATPTTVTLPGVAAAGAFQDDAFQNEAFQDAASGGGYIAYVGAPFTPAVTGQAVSAQVLLTGGAGWDSPDITWDDTDVDWDAAGVGGVIHAVGHAFAPQAQFTNILVGLINQNPVLFAPSPGSVSFGPLPLISRVGFTHTPQQFTEKVNLGLISQVGVAKTPVVQAPQTVELDLIDQSAVLFEFQLNPQAIDALPIILRVGFPYAIQKVNESVTVGLIASTVQVFAPKLDAVALALIPRVGVAFETTVIFNPPPVVLGLIASTVEVFTPPLFLIPFQQTVRLDETDEQFIDNAGVVFQFVSVELALPQSVFIGFIDRHGVALQLRVFLPTRPTIVLHARYDPVTVLKARYDPVTVLHAQDASQG